MLLQHQREALRREAAREIVDVAVALGLAEDRHDAGRIDAAFRDRLLDAAHVIRRGRRRCDGPWRSAWSAARRVEMIAHRRAPDRGSAAASVAFCAMPWRKRASRSSFMAGSRCRARVPSRTTVRPRDDQLLDVARGRSARTGGRADRDRAAAGRRRAPSQSSSRMSAGAPAASAPPSSLLVTERRPLTRTAFEDRLAVDIDAEADAAVQQVGEPHLAQRVVVLVERRAVEPERDAAAVLDHLGERRDAGAQMQVRRGVDRDGGAALGDQLEILRPRPGAMRQREARSLSRPISSR